MLTKKFQKFCSLWLLNKLNTLLTIITVRWCNRSSRTLNEEASHSIEQRYSVNKMSNTCKKNTHCTESTKMPRKKTALRRAIQWNFPLNIPEHRQSLTRAHTMRLSNSNITSQPFDDESGKKSNSLTHLNVTINWEKERGRVRKRANMSFELRWLPFCAYYILSRSVEIGRTTSTESNWQPNKCTQSSHTKIYTNKKQRNIECTIRKYVKFNGNLLLYTLMCSKYVIENTYAIFICTYQTYLFGYG